MPGTLILSACFCMCTAACQGSFMTPDVCHDRAENGVIADWAPDGSMLLVATTAPRLRVDNGLLIMGYHGEHLAQHPMKVQT